MCSVSWGVQRHELESVRRSLAMSDSLPRYVIQDLIDTCDRLLAERVRIERILTELGPAWGGARRASTSFTACCVLHRRSAASKTTSTAPTVDVTPLAYREPQHDRPLVSPRWSTSRAYRAPQGTPAFVLGEEFDRGDCCFGDRRSAGVGSGSAGRGVAGRAARRDDRVHLNDVVEVHVEHQPVTRVGRWRRGS